MVDRTKIFREVLRTYLVAGDDREAPRLVAMLDMAIDEYLHEMNIELDKEINND